MTRIMNESAENSKRVRGPQPRSARAREQIFESALALFREKGYDSTTMREVAAGAGVAVGATYYYFKSKEEIVHEYYVRLEAEATEHAHSLRGEAKPFKVRVKEAIEFKLGQLAPDRSLAKVLARIAADPDNQLSPFSYETRDIRHRTISMLGSLCEESDVQCGKDLRPLLPRLVWLLYMGAIFFWVQDRSPNQRNTHKLVELVTGLLDKVLWLSSLPLTGSINRLVSEVIETIFASFEVGESH
jgi:AcrR family transcriptional regulator